MLADVQQLEDVARTEDDGTASRNVDGRWLTVVWSFGLFRYCYGSHEITRDEAARLLARA